jgi:hypothetical protein
MKDPLQLSRLCKEPVGGIRHSVKVLIQHAPEVLFGALIVPYF